VQMLENVLAKSQEDEKKISDKARNLIESGKVKQWQKLPIYYFVNGLRKVALTINDNGEFVVSKKYPAKDEKENQFIKELLGTA